MKTLSYETLSEQNFNGYLLKDAPERILQFGEGNFLRAFTDHFVDLLNEKAGFNSKIVIVKPRQNHTSVTVADHLNFQDGLYTLYLRGYENGLKINQKRVISCISRCLNAHTDFEELLACAANPDMRYIISNTTEAGITYDSSCQFTDRPALSFPGKLTQFLYRRFELFGTQKGKGFIILPCELIDDNGNELKSFVLRYARQWNLPATFTDWINEENVFCNTLVDRIVTGYPAAEADFLNKENGYVDLAMTAGETFGFWAIEGPDWLKQELPFASIHLPVIVTNDIRPYKQRKVRILNGAHTSMVLGAYLSGKQIVRDCMQDEETLQFLKKAIYKEIIPTLSLPTEELETFASSVIDRFSNPFIDHALLSIALNSTSKWKARILPTLKNYVQIYHTLPECLVTSFAYYLAFYKNGIEFTSDGLNAITPDGREYVIKDEPEVLKFFYTHRNATVADLVHAICEREDFWDEKLNEIERFEDKVVEILTYIEMEC